MGEIFNFKRPDISLPFDGERFTNTSGGPIEVEHLHRYLGAREVCRGKDVLDVASGEGYGSALLAQVARSVLGVELSPNAVSHASNAYGKAGLQFIVGDARRLPCSRCHNRRRGLVRDNRAFQRNRLSSWQRYAEFCVRMDC